MSRPTLYLLPMNGLCNRMQAMAAARALAEAADARLVVLWHVEAGLGCPIEELYERDERVEILTIAPQRSLFGKLLFLLWGSVETVNGVPVGWINRTFSRGFFGKAIRENLAYEDVEDGALLEQLTASRRVLITSWRPFFDKANLDYSCFRPLAAEQAEIDRFSADFDADTVGVHIRRTDNANAIRYSSTEAFIAAMDNCLAEKPSTRFFLASDCAETVDALQSRFGNQIITRKPNLARDSLSGMKDAVIDLFLLARTSRILGSYFSTFSETAAGIGKIPWATVTYDQSLVGRIDAEDLVAK